MSQEEQRWRAAYQKKAEHDYWLFVNGLTIDGARGPKQFFGVMADYQKEVFRALAPSLQAVQMGRMPQVRKFWIERTKKAGKDSDLATCLLWLLAYPKKPLYMQVGAADREQAKIIRERMDNLVHYNPWIAERVQISQYHCRSKDGLAQLDIMAADVAGAHGGTPDLLIINELSHVTKWEFVENLMDNADGVPQGVVIIATNAGFVGTKAHTWKKHAESNEDWACFYWKKPAPWMDKAKVESARLRNPPSRYARLWQGRWVSGKGDAFSEELIQRCFTQLGPELQRQSGWQYVAGLDLGVSHDHSGLVLLGVERDAQKIRCVRWQNWVPKEGREIDLQNVEDTIRQWHQQYKIQWLGYDPSQAKLMAQRLTRRGVPMREVPFTGKNLHEMANTLKQAMEANQLELYDDENQTLQRDLGKLNIVERSYGLRLEATSDESGHADVATALVIALPKAISLMDVRRLEPDDSLDWSDKPTEEDIESMPEELREIYDMAHIPRKEKQDLDDDW